MEVTPQFYDSAGRACALHAGIMYVYIDDFGGWAVLPRVEAPSLSPRAAYPAAEKDLSAVRSRLIDAGLGCHKETVGLPDALGYQVVQRESFSVICEGQRVSKKGQFKEGYF